MRLAECFGEPEQSVRGIHHESQRVIAEPVLTQDDFDEVVGGVQVGPYGQPHPM